VGTRRLTRGIAFAAAIAAALALPAAASATVLYDQTTGTPGGTVTSAHHTPSAGIDADAADDFIVPAGVIWNLGSVDVKGEAPSVVQTGNAVLFADAGGHPGTELFRQSGVPFPGGLVEDLPLTGVPPLPPGHYWISVYTTWSISPWNWRRQSPTYGFPAVWENPANGAGTGCTTFQPLTQCGFAPTQGTDLQFRLNGDAIPIVQRRKCKRRHRHHAAAARKKRCKKGRRR
jgi:hypothetical protein